MEQTQAGSSPAEVVDPFNGNQPSLAEYSSYRETGEIPSRFKPQVTDSPEETVESEAEKPEGVSESEPEENQEPPQKVSPAEKRIKQLLAEKKDLERKLEEAAKKDVKTDSSPAKAELAPTPQHTRPKPNPDDIGTDGKPKYASYEAYIDDMTDWKAEQQLARFRQEQAQQEALRTLKVKVDEARARYEDADAVILPAGKAINDAQIPAAVKAVFSESDLFLDLCYVVGSDPAELKNFITLAQNQPRAAIAKVFEYERAIREELDGGKNETERGKAPEPRKTSAPKPPSPVGGSSSRAFDVSDESISPEEWARKRTQDLKKRGKA